MAKKILLTGINDRLLIRKKGIFDWLQLYADVHRWLSEEKYEVQELDFKYKALNTFGEDHEVKLYAWRNGGGRLEEHYKDGKLDGISSWRKDNNTKYQVNYKDGKAITKLKLIIDENGEIKELPLSDDEFEEFEDRINGI